jgi:glucokinase
MVDDTGRTLGYLSIPTNPEFGPEDGAQRMGEAAHEVIASAGLKVADVARIGLGTPGTMDIPAGMFLEPVNIPSWRQFPIRDRVAHHAGLPVTFANDASSAAYGEYWIGSGRGMHSIVLFTLGTGIGSGIIIGDLDLKGEHSHGAECGHAIIDYRDDARLCNCGHRGHLEPYASATAVVKRTEEALDGGRKSSLVARIEREPLTALMIAQEAEAGDSLAMEIVLDTARYLAVGVVSVMHTIDPDGVMIGGGMTFGGNASPLGRQFMEKIREEVRNRALPIPAAKTRIDFAQLGGDAGYIGAAGLARLDYRKLAAAK